MQAGAGFEVREITIEDIPFLTPIGKGQLGVDYISDEDFEKAISDPGQFCLTPVVDGVPSGFAICKEFGPESEPEALALPDSGYRDWVRSRSRIGLVDSVALSPSVGGRGIGKALCEACLERFSEDGCDSAVSMAWVHEDGVEPIRKALTQSGFERTDLVIRGYWNSWVDTEGGHMCPYCGSPCRCSGALWRKSL